MSQPSFRTRRARPEDFPRLVELWREMMAFHETLDPRFAISPGGPDAYGKYLREAHQQMDTQVLVAEDAKRIVGYTVATIMENPAIYALPRYGYIGEMAVEEASRRGGVGRGLWRAALEWFQRRAITVVQLNVSPGNQPGQQFWRGLGFRDYLDILWFDVPQR